MICLRYSGVVAMCYCHRRFVRLTGCGSKSTRAFCIAETQMGFFRIKVCLVFARQTGIRFSPLRFLMTIHPVFKTHRRDQAYVHFHHTYIYKTQPRPSSGSSRVSSQEKKTCLHQTLFLYFQPRFLAFLYKSELTIVRKIVFSSQRRMVIVGRKAF